MEIGVPANEQGSAKVFVVRYTADQSIRLYPAAESPSVPTTDIQYNIFAPALASRGGIRRRQIEDAIKEGDTIGVTLGELALLVHAKSRTGSPTVQAAYATIFTPKARGMVDDAAREIGFTVKERTQPSKPKVEDTAPQRPKPQLHLVENKPPQAN